MTERLLLIAPLCLCFGDLFLFHSPGAAAVSFSHILQLDDLSLRRRIRSNYHVCKRPIRDWSVSLSVSDTKLSLVSTCYGYAALENRGEEIIKAMNALILFLERIKSQALRAYPAESNRRSQPAISFEYSRQSVICSGFAPLRESWPENVAA